MVDAAPPPLIGAATPHWRLLLLGQVVLIDSQQQPVRLPGRMATALLARLAMAPQRDHPREELVELFWPGVAISAGRNRLRQLLSMLKDLLEPKNQAWRVLESDRMSLRIRPGALLCDVPAFEAAWAGGRHGEAHAWYRGELMPGLYDDWVAVERLRLAGLAERLPPARPAAAPPLTPTPLPQPALPRYLTRLLGAETACDVLVQAVADHRLVTLFGAGGSGKTRLAVEAATRMAEAAGRSRPGAHAFDTVIFVPLADCSGLASMIDALLLALRLPPQAAEPLTALSAALQGRRMLLVLDNVEQLVDDAAPWLALLLASTDGLHLLLTSRRVLGLDGERTLPQQPLPLPAHAGDTARTEPGAHAFNPAVALFADRARAANAEFELDERQLPAVVELVQLLEGLPLAIELAAARVRSLPPALLVEHLRRAVGAPSAALLALLARNGPRSGGDPRQASMLRVLDWSWQLLPAEARGLLARLAVCRGGFTLATAQALAAELAAPECRSDVVTTPHPPADPARCLLLIDTLVGHSLLRPDESSGGGGGAARWHIGEMTREYALLQLAPDQARNARRALRRSLTDWAGAQPAGPPLVDVRAELPNITAALESAVTDGAAPEAADLALALQGGFSDMSLPAGLLQALAAAAQVLQDTDQRALVETALARAWHRAGDPGATDRHAQAAWSCLPASGLARAQVLARLAHVRWRRTRDPAVAAWLHEALAHAAGAPALQASALATLGAIARPLDPAQAIALQRRALAAWTDAGDLHGRHTGLYNLALALAERPAGRAEALGLVEQVIAGTRASQDWGQLANGQTLKAELLADLRQWPAAAAASREAIAVAWAALDSLPLAYALWNLPRAWAHLRRPVDAARLMAFAASFWRQRYGVLSASDQHDLRRLRRLLAGQLDAAALARHGAEGERLTLGAAVALALST